MPFKSLADRHHHIPKQRHRVTNWAAYDAGLRGRGSLTIWFTEAAIATWRAEPTGGVLTGRGADFIMIDDPLKPDQALSKALR